MKNFLLFLLSAMLMLSCETTETHKFAMQASIDGELYQSSIAQGAVAADGSVIIEGTASKQAITLQLSHLSVGTFQMGQEFSNSAFYEAVDGQIYKTDPKEPGMVTISKINEANKTLEGTFHFRAVLPGIDTVYVSRGVLYNISYAGGQIGDPAADGSFSATVDNEPFVAMAVSAIDDGEEIAINGITSSATIGITVPNTVAEGDYVLPKNGFDMFYQNIDGRQTTTEGTISITEHNSTTKTLKGTFFFTTELSEITEGQFEVTYR